MKRWLFYWAWAGCCLLLGSACGQGEEKPLAERQAMLQSGLASRFRESSPLPLHDSLLRKALPAYLPGYDTAIDRGATFQSPVMAFSEVTRTFYGAEGYYLQLRLADYAADSAGFFRIWRNFVQAEVGDTMLHPLAGHPRRFAWTRQDSRRGVSVLEAGMDYRYHLIVSGKLNPAGPAPEVLWEEIEWKKMPLPANRRNAFLGWE